MSSFIPVARISEFARGSRRVINLGDREILIIRGRDRFYAIANICTCPGFVVAHSRPGDEEDPLTHGGRLARLEPGVVESGSIRCPAHQSCFDLETGRPIGGMAEIALATFPTRVDGDMLMVSRLSVHETRMGFG